jgi:large subunit ribosomal protein L24
MKIKVGDKVMIITGKDKGKSGHVIAVYAKQNRVKVEKLNLRIKHIKKKQGQPGEKITFEAPLNASNVMVIDPKTSKPTRIRYQKLASGKKERISTKSGLSIDNQLEEKSVSTKSTKKVKV